MTSLDEARARREDGIARSAEAAKEEWKRTTTRAAHWVATQNRYFTSDDIWEALETYYPGVDTPEHRAMGHIMRAVVSRKWARLMTCDSCQTIKVMRQSRRARANCMDTPVYESLCYGQGAST